MPDSFDLAPSTLEELHERIGAAHRRFAELVATTPATTTVGAWTGRDVVAHLVTVVNRYTAFAPERLAADPRGVDAINARELDALADQHASTLLDRLDAEMATFQTMWGPTSGLALDLPVPFHGGGTLDVQSALTNALGELLVHGFDLASAAGHPWPIADRDAALLCRFATRILPAYVRTSNTDDIDLCVEADDLPPWTAQVRGPAVTITFGRPAPDSSVPAVSIRGRASAVALLLYGRTPPLEDRPVIAGAPDSFSVSRYFEEP